ncbi:SDR family oxidoreductase [Pedobacter hartonius]|uniref:Short-chain dehydrogenase n=1 Tax=Pedobacter hartonius TaxID=425514 RepID=A0A1H4CE33_9SPHI|nr:SDR family oxidoreductase [Pedobacter hartonius]SEA58634.1 Short-chain dehydrogenase [Pedobacter hartonius]
MDFKDKVVIVTGASSGIGKSCAEEFAKRGAKVVLAARQFVTLCEIAAGLEQKYGVKALAVQADVTKEEECEQLIKQAVSTFGKVDILLNSAGISMRALFIEMDLSVIRTVMEVNFYGAVYCTKFALPEILKTKGAIVGVSSSAGYRGLPGRTAYTASKFALNGFMEALRTELLRKGVLVMVASPGFTTSNIRVTALDKNGEMHGATNMDEGKMMSPEEVAERIANGIAGRKRDLIMTVQGKLAIWMNKLFPALTDKLVYKHYQKEGTLKE